MVPEIGGAKGLCRSAQTVPRDMSAMAASFERLVPKFAKCSRFDLGHTDQPVSRGSQHRICETDPGILSRDRRVVQIFDLHPRLVEGLTDCLELVRPERLSNLRTTTLEHEPICPEAKQADVTVGYKPRCLEVIRAYLCGAEAATEPPIAAGKIAGQLALAPPGV
jgi:hypothetical protein